MNSEKSTHFNMLSRSWEKPFVHKIQNIGTIFSKVDVGINRAVHIYFGDEWLQLFDILNNVCFFVFFFFLTLMLRFRLLPQEPRPLGSRYLQICTCFCLITLHNVPQIENLQIQFEKCAGFSLEHWSVCRTYACETNIISSNSVIGCRRR